MPKVNWRYRPFFEKAKKGEMPKVGRFSGVLEKFEGQDHEIDLIHDKHGPLFRISHPELPEHDIEVSSEGFKIRTHVDKGSFFFLDREATEDETDFARKAFAQTFALSKEATPKKMFKKAFKKLLKREEKPLSSALLEEFVGEKQVLLSFLRKCNKLPHLKS